MKMMAVTMRHAKKTCVLLGWQRMLFFEDPAPAADRLVTVEIPQVRYREDGERLYRDIVAHLGAGEGGKKRESVLLPPALWRPAVLDDILDADNGEQQMYGLSSHFSSDALAEFAARTTPEIAGRLRAILEERGDARRKRYGRERRFLASACGVVLWGLPQRLEIERAREQTAADRARVKAFDAPEAVAARAALSDDDALAAYLRLLGASHTALGRRLALRRFADRFVPKGSVWEEVEPVLRRLAAHKRARAAAEAEGTLWERVAPALHLPATLTGATVDLSGAREETVRMGFDLLDARRVGAIVPGRTALVVRDSRYRITTLVRGERKLLQAIRASADGRLVRHGCILTVGDAKASPLRRLILDAERIDTLAALDPEAALAGAGLGEDHPAFALAARARTDHRQARALADLLIEETCGVDAEVLRAMSRAQERRGRR